MTPSMTYPTSDLTDLLTGAGVPAGYAGPCAARLGERAAERLRADPWELLLVPGVRPEQADHFARQVLEPGARPDDPRRGRALVVYLLSAAARQGHTALPAKAIAERLIPLNVADPVQAVMDALDEALIVGIAVEEPSAFEEDEEPEPQEVLALARYAMAEEAAAEGFMRLTATAEPLPGAPVENGLTLLSGPASDKAALALAAQAAEAGLRTVVATVTDRRARDLVRTGPFLAAPNPAPVADGRPTDPSHDAGRPTGPADAGEAGQVVVVSLQGLLEAVHTAGGMAFRRGEQRPLEADVVVVVDATALDVEQAAALVEACADGTRLVLAGDPAEVASPGPGQVFADLVASRTVPVVRTQSAGPEAEGPIELLLGAAREGELVPVDAPGREVVVVPAGAPAEAVHRAVQLVTDSIPRAIGVPVDEVQVVAPAQQGEAGTAALNKALKDQLNPGPGTYGGFDPGDRVIVVAPLVGAAVGETGVVQAGGPGGLEVEFPGGPVTVTPGQAARLRHGWAITIQQSAGTRWPAVVAVFTVEPAAALSRPLVATAIGRAQRHLSIVHAAGPDLAKAVADATGRPRQTRLAALMRGA